MCYVLRSTFYVLRVMCCVLCVACYVLCVLRYVLRFVLAFNFYVLRLCLTLTVEVFFC